MKRPALIAGLWLGLGVNALLPVPLLVVRSFAGGRSFPALLPTEWNLRAWQSAFAPTLLVFAVIAPRVQGWHV